MSNRPSTYHPREERLNIISHAFGLVLSILALIFLVVRAVDEGGSSFIASFSIFGASMVLLYAASTFYHSATNFRIRYRLNILDHASIYVLIAGTYTPFALVTLSGFTGTLILVVIWAMALTGVILKLFFTGRYQLLSTIMYVVMGWVIVFAIKPLLANLSSEGLWWLFGGGISYTLGAVLFMLDRIPYNHAIFHLFVLGGTFCHFMAIYFHV